MLVLVIAVCEISKLYISLQHYRRGSETTSQWRHNERNSVSNLRRLDCVFNRLFRRRSKKIKSPPHWLLWSLWICGHRKSFHSITSSWTFTWLEYGHRRANVCPSTVLSPAGATLTTQPSVFSAMLLWKLVTVNHQWHHIPLLDSLFMMLTGQYSALSIYRGHFSLKNSRKTLHSSPVRPRYGVSFAGVNAGRRVAVVFVVLCAISCYTWLRIIESLQFDINRSVSISAVCYR